MVALFKRIFKISAVLCLSILLLNFAGCGQSNPLEAKAKNFVQTVLTAPSEQFTELVALTQDPQNINLYDEYAPKAIEDICSGFVSAEAIANSGGTLYQDILLWHSMAAFEGYTYDVGEVEITSAGNLNYRYKAEITASNVEDKFFLTGSIQFNNNNLIDYFSINFSS